MAFSLPIKAYTHILGFLLTGVAGSVPDSWDFMDVSCEAALSAGFVGVPLDPRLSGTKPSFVCCCAIYVGVKTNGDLASSLAMEPTGCFWPVGPLPTAM